MLRHDCVTLPGIGALIARYIPAHFSPETDCRLLPPSRQIVFNGRLEQSDGLLERSVSRRSGISYEAASRIVAEETGSLRSQLIEFGELSLGKLGYLFVDENSSVIFHAAPASDWDCRFYHLDPLELTPILFDSETNPHLRIAPPTPPYIPDETADGAPPRRGLARKLIGVAATLALIITLALSFFNPVTVNNEPEKASFVPEKVSPDAKEEVDEISMDKIEDVPSETAAEAPDLEPPSDINDADNYNFYIIVASFPDSRQAESYLAANPGRNLGVLHKDGKFRIYAAVAASRSEAERLRAQCGQADAWVCSK